MAEAEQKRPQNVAPFTVQFGDKLNSNAFVIGCLSRLEVRGTWKRENVPASSLGESMSQMPEIPGQQMTVLPRERKAIVTDPLADQQELVAKANAILDGTAQARTGGGMVAHPKMELPLADDDLVKTLVFTLADWVKCGNCIVVKGKVPTPEEIDNMPGDLLYDPANSNQHGHPRYVKDVDAWRHKLEMGAAA